ncbi:ImmA/IrrE family metallo-endopeptidase [Leeuwenhoekiella sp. LLG6367-2.1]|uniref:ImmA/IrrE family metallo-endopeptidase n=1 Tax=Leeuwenhoekiella sp. LLG6367-2.1 TaxID=3160833 RepID=UPI003864019D
MGYKRNSLEDTVEYILKKQNITSYPVRVKEIIKNLNITIKEDYFEDDLSGALVIRQGSAKMVINSTNSPVRRRFTMAHELGHFILHVDTDSNGNDIFVDNALVMFRKGGGRLSNIENRREREANAFAANLLMPKSFVQKAFRTAMEKFPYFSDDEIIGHLAKEFEVSESAMTFRAMNLKLISN